MEKLLHCWGAFGISPAEVGTSPLGPRTRGSSEGGGLARPEDLLHCRGVTVGLDTLTELSSCLLIHPTCSGKAFGPYPGAPFHAFVPFIILLFKNTFLFISAESFSSSSSSFS